MKSLIRNTWLQLAVCSAIIIACIYYRFILGDHLFIFSHVGSDTYYQYWPFNHLYGHMLKNRDVNHWSLLAGIGKQLNLVKACHNPFLLFLYLVPSSVELHARVYKVILEILVATGMWCIYLRTVGVRKTALVIFSLLFGFNGYMTLWGQHDSFGVVFTLVPLSLCAFELLLRKRRVLPLILSLALFVSCSYYLFYMFSLFFLPFAVIRYAAVHEWKWRDAGTTIAALGGCILVALLLAAWTLWPTLSYVTSSSRIGADTQTGFVSLYSLVAYIATVFRLFSNNVFGAGFAYRGPPNYYEMPQLYCGMLTLLLIPQFFRIARKRERALAAGTMALLLLAILIPCLAVVFNGFSSVSYRHTFLLIALAVYVAARAFHAMERHGGLHRPLLVVTALVLSLPAAGTLALAPLIISDAITLPVCMLDRFLIMMQCSFPSATSSDLTLAMKNGLLPAMMKQMAIVLGFLWGYTVLLMRYSAPRRTWINRILIALVVCEIVVLTYPTVNHRITLKKSSLANREGYMDYTREALAWIKTQEGPDAFYRIDKTYNSVFLDDAIVQGYNGTKCYVSVNEPAYVRFLLSMNVPLLFNKPNYVQGFGNRHLLNTLVGVKYVLAREPLDRPDRELIQIRHGIHIYRNNAWLPLGFAYASHLDPTRFAALPEREKDHALLTGFVPDAKLNAEEAAANTREATRDATDLENVERLRTTPFLLESVGDDAVSGTITTDTSAMVFFSIPWNRGWNATVDGQPRRIHQINMGFIGVPIDAGHHTVELRFIPHGSCAGRATSATTGILILIALLFRCHRRRANAILRP